VHQFVVQRSSEKLGPENMRATCQYTFYENDQVYCSIGYRLASNGLYIVSAGVTVSNSPTPIPTNTHWAEYTFDFYGRGITVNWETPTVRFERQRFPFPFDQLPTTPSDLTNLETALLFLPVTPIPSQLFPNELKRLHYFEPIFKAWGDLLHERA